MFNCDSCNATFRSESALNRHKELNICHLRNTHICFQCGKNFTRAENLRNHTSRLHSNIEISYKCTICNNIFTTGRQLRQHMTIHVLNNDFHEIASALNRVCSIYRLQIPQYVLPNIESLALYSVKHIRNHIVTQQQRESQFKLSMVVQARFIRDPPEDQNHEFYSHNVNHEEEMWIPIRSFTEEITISSNLSLFINNAFNKVSLTIDDLVSRGSYWRLDKFQHIELEYGQCRPIYGACGLHAVEYRRSIEEPKFYSKSELRKVRKNKCFFYAIARHFTGSEKLTELNTFISNKMNIKGIKSPVLVKDIPKFEAKNNHLDLHISVVFNDHNNVWYPIYVSKNIEAKNRVTLALFYASNHNMYTKIKKKTNEFSEDDLTSSGEEEDEGEKDLSYIVEYDTDDSQDKTYRPGQRLDDDSDVIISDDSSEDEEEKKSRDQRKKMNRKRKREKILNIESSDDEEKTPKRLKENEKLESHCQFLHYAYLSDPSLVFAERHVTEGGNFYTTRKYFCYNCFNYMKSEEALKNHEKWCHLEGAQRKLFPVEGENDTLSYKKSGNTIKSTYTVIYDFEMRKVEKNLTETKHSKILYEQHAFSFCLIVIDRTGKVHEEITYMGDDAGEVFMNKILDIQDKYMKKIDEMVQMDMTKEEEEKHANATNCYICEERFYEDNPAYRDHDHLTGEYLGAAHNICNLKR